MGVLGETYIMHQSNAGVALPIIQYVADLEGAVWFSLVAMGIHILIKILQLELG